MAKAKTNGRVKLTLTRDEAETLFDLLGRVGGHDRTTGHRDRINSIYHAMRYVGVTSPETPIPLRSTPHIQEPN